MSRLIAVSEEAAMPKREQLREIVYAMLVDVALCPFVDYFGGGAEAG